MAGEVVAVGVGVNKFKAGDKVLAMINPFVSSTNYFSNIKSTKERKFRLN